jgi:hypothetical protein
MGERTAEQLKNMQTMDLSRKIQVMQTRIVEFVERE